MKIGEYVGWFMQFLCGMCHLFAWGWGEWALNSWPPTYSQVLCCWAKSLVQIFKYPTTKGLSSFLHISHVPFSGLSHLCILMYYLTRITTLHTFRRCCLHRAQNELCFLDLAASLCTAVLLTAHCVTVYRLPVSLSPFFDFMYVFSHTWLDSYFLD